MNATGDEVFLEPLAVLRGRVDHRRAGEDVPRLGNQASDGNIVNDRSRPMRAFVNMSASVGAERPFGVRIVPVALVVWALVAQGIVLPVNRSNVILDHDGYSRREEKAATPAVLAACSHSDTKSQTRWSRRR